MNKTLAAVAPGTWQPPLTAKMANVVERMARAGHPSLDQFTPDEAKASYEKGAGVLEVLLAFASFFAFDRLLGWIGRMRWPPSHTVVNASITV